MEKETLGIYIHIPFCKQKCYYCDFISYCEKDNLIEKYIKCLICEINTWANKNKDKYNLTTIYIGGGTPSYIDSKYIEDILDAINNNIENLNNVEEITIEINPGTITKEKLKQYKLSGINRLSIGLQSTENKLLKQIGRIHGFEEFLETYKMSKEEFNNINIDLIIGLPNQTIENINKSISEVIKLNPNHISVYSLILEEGTRLYNLVNERKLNLPSEDLERNMYWYVKNRLELEGYKHYEISNFSKENFESKHNTNCWEQKQYIGFGVAAHSYIGNIRFSNTKSIEEYIKNIENENIEKNVTIEEKQNMEDIKKEYMLLGLRKINGISIKKFKNKFSENPIYIFRNELSKLAQEGLIEINADQIKLTNKGLDLANLVWEEFI